MGLFNKLFGNKEPIPPTAKDEAHSASVAKEPGEQLEKTKQEKEVKVKQPKVPKPKPKKSAKELATEKGEPYVNIESVELDPENIGQGAFELDWNEFFVAKLIRAGYKGKDDQQIVDQWFQDVCRNVVLETFEQYEANNPRPPSGVSRRDLGGGRSEIS